MKKLSIVRPGSPRPWLLVVQNIRARYDDQRWRLAALDSTEGWRDFAVAWSGAATLLREYGIANVCPNDLVIDDDVMAWAWDVVGPRVSEAIEVCASRSRLDELSTLAVFEALQSAGLIYPDGEVSRRVMDRLSRDVMLREAAESLALSRTNEELIKLQQAQVARAAMAAQQGKATP